MKKQDEFAAYVAAFRGRTTVVPSGARAYTSGDMRRAIYGEPYESIADRAARREFEAEQRSEQAMEAAFEATWRRNNGAG